LTAKIQDEERSYSQLMDQYEQARLQEALQTNSVSIAEPAAASSTPRGPRRAQTLALGLLVGLVGGGLLALLLEKANPRLRGLEDVTGAGMALIGQVPAMTSSKRGAQKALPTLYPDRNQLPVAEAFRTLGASVIAIAQREGFRSLLLTSAEPGSGKSTVVANLAVALAQAGYRVIAIDGNLRRPSLHTLFGLRPSAGLAELARGASPVESVLQETKVPGLRLVLAGLVPGDLGASGAAPRLRGIAERLTGMADLVLWDSPAVLASADAVLAAQATDAALLVAAEDRTTIQVIQRALLTLNQAGVKVAGVIHNRASEGDSLYAYPRQPYAQPVVAPNRHTTTAPVGAAPEQQPDKAARAG
jgi:capsular exopolysaccharide synthesis family protein